MAPSNPPTSVDMDKRPVAAYLTAAPIREKGSSEVFLSVNLDPAGLNLAVVPRQSLFDIVERGLQLSHGTVFHGLSIVSQAQNAAHDGLPQGIALS